jgi:hypothetical protein
LELLDEGITRHGSHEISWAKIKEVFAWKGRVKKNEKELQEQYEGRSVVNRLRHIGCPASQGPCESAMLWVLVLAGGWVYGVGTWYAYGIEACGSKYSFRYNIQ